MQPIGISQLTFKCKQYCDPSKKKLQNLTDRLIFLSLSLSLSFGQIFFEFLSHLLPRSKAKTRIFNNLRSVPVLYGYASLVSATKQFAHFP